MVKVNFNVGRRSDEDLDKAKPSTLVLPTKRAAHCYCTCTRHWVDAPRAMKVPPKRLRRMQCSKIASLPSHDDGILLVWTVCKQKLTSCKNVACAFSSLGSPLGIFVHSSRPEDRVRFPGHGWTSFQRKEKKNYNENNPDQVTIEALSRLVKISYFCGGKMWNFWKFPGHCTGPRREACSVPKTPPSWAKAVMRMACLASQDLPSDFFSHNS